MGGSTGREEPDFGTWDDEKAYSRIDKVSIARNSTQTSN
jgi:hypothetical protein